MGPGHVQPAGYDVRTLIRDGRADRFAVLAGLPGASELDSLAVDSSGAVCVGTLMDSGITEISADGASIELWELPAPLADGAVTNICFGGADLTTAYVTLSLTGRLISCRWHRPGLALEFPKAAAPES